MRCRYSARTRLQSTQLYDLLLFFEANAISVEDRPKQLGEFEILRELGRGGMGVVYEARQKSLNRRVALKVLSAGLGLTTKAVMRFKREAEAAAKLHHTNIVPIYSTGDEGRIPYYAMELVDGPSLDQVIRQLRHGSDDASKGSLDSTDDASPNQPSSVPAWVTATIGLEKPNSGSARATLASSNSSATSSFGSGTAYFDNVARMMSGVADALAHAHDQGVIHRDIKPSNLLLSQDGRLSVNDFGLARMLEQPGMTMSGELMGSPMYMSPEQIAVGRIPLDHRTDIYSLGASLYQVLTLQTPFDGQQRDQVLSQIIHKEPTRPRAVNREIPNDLETICLKAMDKDPDRRYQTADQMADDLRRFVSRHAISARRIGSLERATRWARKNKAVAVMACLTLMIGLSAFVVVYGAWQSNRTVHRDKAKEQALQLAMSGDLKGAIESIQIAKKLGATEDWALMLSGQVDIFRGNATRAVEQLETAVGQDADNVVAQSLLARAYMENGQWGRYEEKLKELLSMTAVTPTDQLFKGYGIVAYDGNKALDLMSKAIEQQSDSRLGRVIRGRARLAEAMNRANPELLTLGDRDLAVASEGLKENPFLSQSWLFRNLVAYRIYSRENNIKLAEKSLDDAAEHVKQLDKYPSYLMANQKKLYYYAFRSDVAGMERVMEDVIAHGNSGFVGDAYFAYCFGVGRNEDALKQLARMDRQDNFYLLVSRVLLLSDTPANRRLAEPIHERLLERPPGFDLSYSWLFLLGKRDEAIQAAKQYAKTMDTATDRWFEHAKIRFQGGLIGEQELLEQAGDSELDKGQAYYHIGVHHLSAGNRAAALENFEKSAGTLVFDYTDVTWARAFVERMKRDPDWPNWLAAKPIDLDGM